jgi:hypothetical protein
MKYERLPLQQTLNSLALSNRIPMVKPTSQTYPTPVPGTFLHAGFPASVIRRLSQPF